jgi:site-specific DNA-methyltransferase (adenine-specific)
LALDSTSRENDSPGAPSFARAAAATQRENVAKGGSLPQLPAPVFHDAKHHIKIFHGDCLEILAAIPAASIDLIFADPPYFLSNGGITCHAGRMVSVNKGDWDRSRGADANHQFNREWLAACQRVLKPDASIWVSGLLTSFIPSASPCSSSASSS